MKKTKDFNKIVLAVDGSDISKKAAKKAFSLAKETGIDVTAIHVFQVPTNVYSTAISDMHPHTSSAYIKDITNSIKKDGEKILDETAKMGSDMGVKVKKELVEGTPDDEIIKLANKNDLIIMGCKGHSVFGRILIGSVSEKVLHHSDATVMIVR
jgi:nucleotide-binding universal stress UspA family protein